MTLLLLHGLGATGDVWRGFPRGLTPDLPGHGSAEWASPYSFEGHARALDLPDDPVTVIGHSMGGVVGLTLAALFPERVAKVVGVGIKVVWSGDDVAKAQALATRPPTVFPTYDEAATRSLKVSGLHGLLDEPPARSVVEVESGWRLAQDPATFGVGVPDVAGLLRRVACPVVLARGEHDPLVSDDDLGGVVPNPVRLDGRGHNVHVEAPADVVALLDR